MAIIQSANWPLLISFEGDISEVSDFYITIGRQGSIWKSWKKASVTMIDSQTLRCDLTEEETAEMPAGLAELNIKWYVGGVVYFAEPVIVEITRRNDRSKIFVRYR